MREHYSHTVGPPLDRYVRLAVGYRYAGAPPGVHVGLPSGTLTLVVPFDEPLHLSGVGLSRRTPFEGVLAGLATAPTLIHHEGRQHGVQLGLTPAGARAIFGTDYDHEPISLAQWNVICDRLTGTQNPFRVFTDHDTKTPENLLATLSRTP